MKRSIIIAAATTGLIALSGATYAANSNETNDASELSQFLGQNPAMQDQDKGDQNGEMEGENEASESN